MSLQNGRDYLYLIWKAPLSRRQYVIGQLSKNGVFEFSYKDEVDKAIEEGFKLLISFSERDKVYCSDMLFPEFSSRLPDKKRKGINEILLKYGLHEFDEYELLKKCGARLPIDNLYFIDPILDNGEEEITRTFYLAGPKHYLGCSGKDCSVVKDIDINIGDELQFDPEPLNEKDPNAIKVLTKAQKLLGYIPRYYAQPLLSLLSSNYNCTALITNLNEEQNCNECIEILLKCTKIKNI